MELINVVFRDVLEKNELVYCAHCNDVRRANWVKVERCAEKRSIKFNYMGLECRCSKCNELCFPASLGDYNVYLMQEAFRIQEDLIPLDIIRNIPQKYNIGLRPISKVLGLGEHTFTRYYNGEIPNSKNSELLKRIYASPKEYRRILCENSSNVSELAMKKSLQAVDALIDDLNTDSVVRTVACFICDELPDISALALQKLLYYIQGFYAAIFDDNCYNSLCYAWKNGPVYPSVYYRNKEGNLKTDDNLSNKEREDLLSDQLIEVINAVIKYFGCYSGDTLKAFTHSETPWLLNRVPDNDDVEIPFDCLKTYFDSVIEKFDIKNIFDIKSYALDTFQKI